MYIWRSGEITIAVLWNGGAMNKKKWIPLFACTIGARKPGQSGFVLLNFNTGNVHGNGLP